MLDKLLIGTPRWTYIYAEAGVKTEWKRAKRDIGFEDVLTRHVFALFLSELSRSSQTGKLLLDFRAGLRRGSREAKNAQYTLFK